MISLCDSLLTPLTVSSTEWPQNYRSPTRSRWTANAGYAFTTPPRSHHLKRPHQPYNQRLQRFNHAQPQPSTSSTPVSRTTPDTLRTLEANWRERRRAKLEDITLQRAMGVESPARGTARKARAVDDEKRGALVPQQVAIRTIATARRPLEPVTTNLAPTSSDNGKPAPTALKTEPSTRSRRSIAEEDHATVTGNNTTSQGRTNRARKIVKLVRDARLSVQPVQGTVTMRDSGVSSSGKVHSEKKTSPRVKTCCSPATALTNVSSTPHLSSATAAPTKHPPNRPETSATPRRVSEIRRIAQHSPEPLTSPSKRSPRPRCSGSPSRPTEPQPITASPLPAREYSLSPTSSLVVYPYEQDWSADPLPTPSPGKRTKRRPILSAMTGMERMDMVDGGMTMRIKPSRSAEGTRYLDLREQGRWSSEDRRRWEVLGELVTRLKSRTRRATYDFPQGTVHIMCNDPPDVVFYTTIDGTAGAGRWEGEGGRWDGRYVCAVVRDDGYLVSVSRAGHVLAFKTHVEDLDALRTVDKGSTSAQDIPETKPDEPILSFPTHRQSQLKLDYTTAPRDIRTSENSNRA
ncbi:hypothetical protein QFC20_005293 [Naganishia adeliensis]|uniref:Uncharacterized protein n=1 Tax=Naganishia adeliensis TaxID=92952 RepID=A0ACC2VPS2_9TREE|nr:hypothetical protein QFC20_005293 [Naganishia adeliensis]